MDFHESPGSTSAVLELVGVVAAAPEAVWRCFTDADAITNWWSPEATAEPVVGGRIVAAWPDMGWTMRGAFTELVESRVVAFTWSWDHEPARPEGWLHFLPELADAFDD